MDTPSGRFVLRLEPDLHSRAKRSAARSGISLNEFCTRAIEAYVSGTFAAPVETLKGLLGSSLRGVLLFGSVARGEQREGSDVDLLIIVSTDTKLTRQLYTTWDQHILDSQLSPHFVHQPSETDSAGSIWLEAAIDGIVMYEVDRTLSIFLRDLRAAMLAGGCERKMAYGHPYWVRREVPESHVQ